MNTPNGTHIEDADAQPSPPVQQSDNALSVSIRPCSILQIDNREHTEKQARMHSDADTTSLGKM